MANRDYYGDNVPLNLIGEQESRQFPHPQTQIQSPDSRSAFGQGAFVGHEDGKKSDHGVLGTIGGAIAGAFAANLASNAVKNHGNDHGNNYGYDHGHYHGHRGRLSCGERHRQRKIARLERKLDRLQ
ncbi:unnamed protein product [Aspergillus oryzae var. brunneus]|uniref:Unnamed protein product n=2 Tax=Aspergillus oryzae TaxID=5062 RepID=A0AAN4YW43_ASPOZ|nr:unnamed protein product [Aspergillus oryzae]GMG36557.1 unnamed protein product [Aspergillus oryzae]GMG41611.1 unnamed protein product [Aspergillus oryzae var. brunneus]